MPTPHAGICAVDPTDCVLDVVWLCHVFRWGWEPADGPDPLHPTRPGNELPTQPPPGSASSVDLAHEPGRRLLSYPEAAPSVWLPTTTPTLVPGRSDRATGGHHRGHECSGRGNTLPSHHERSLPGSEAKCQWPPALCALGRSEERRVG